MLFIILNKFHPLNFLDNMVQLTNGKKKRGLLTVLDLGGCPSELSPGLQCGASPYFSLIFKLLHEVQRNKNEFSSSE